MYPEFQGQLPSSECDNLYLLLQMMREVNPSTIGQDPNHNLVILNPEAVIVPGVTAGSIAQLLDASCKQFCEVNYAETGETTIRLLPQSPLTKSR